MINLGAVIRRRRDLAGLSQLDLAMAVGYKNGGDISRVETGKQWPDPVKLFAIAKELGCSVTDLFAEAESKSGRPRVSDTRAEYAVDRSVSMPEPGRSYLDRGDPPSLDDALKDVDFMLSGTDQRELLAAIAFQGMMTRYATDRICSSINSLVMAIESLRDSPRDAE